MPNLKVSLRNCYGIRELDEDFSFDIGPNESDRTKTYAIYAPNGSMKSSFARAFYAVQENIKGEPRDRMYPERKSVCNIKWDGANISPDRIYVVEPFSEKSFEEPPMGIARLLANDKLKKRYEEVYRGLGFQKDELIKQLQKISKSTDCESELIATFSIEKDKKTIYEIFAGVEPSVLDGKYCVYNFKYNDVFDKAGKVKEFVLKNRELLQDYANTYDRLLCESTFFDKKSSFGTYQANKIQSDTKGDEFFGAGHKFKLKDLDHDIQSQKEFSEVINQEIDKIISNKDARAAFKKIDDALQANQGLRNFQAVLGRDNSIVAKIINYDNFKSEVWYGFISEVSEDLCRLNKTYCGAKPEIDRIISEASGEQGLWKDAVGEFNRRFKNLPFRLIISNQEDVILSTNTPTVEFEFDDRTGDGGRSTERKYLMSVLSRGEMRALYLLNIIFDMKARKADNKETIYIFDDVVDSFDYKNKYAIVQYLKDIAEVDIFYQIILTHNFDFFRTIDSRGIVNYNDCRLAYKSGNVTKLKPMLNFRKPFLDWKNKLYNDQNKLIASIPFARNIIEFTGSCDSDDYHVLTKMLHVKNGSLTLRVGDLNKVLEKTFNRISLPANVDDLIYDMIINKAVECSNLTRDLELEEKIILSIASRLVAEKYMRLKLCEDSLVKLEDDSNQTAKMIVLYKKENEGESKEIINLLDDILLKTPENIHLNAFMYEPIIDLGSDELKDLFKVSRKVFV